MNGVTKTEVLMCILVQKRSSVNGGGALHLGIGVATAYTQLIESWGSCDFRTIFGKAQGKKFLLHGN